MIPKSTKVIIFIIGVLMTCPVWAIFIPDVDLQKLCSNASVIVAGHVTSVAVTDKTFCRIEYAHERICGIWQAQLMIEQVIKGGVQEETITVGFLGPQKHETNTTDFVVGFQQLNPKERVVLFLSTNVQQTAAYSLANDYQSAIGIADSTTVTQLLGARPVSKSPEQQIASLLIASLDGDDCSRRRVDQILSDLASLQKTNALPFISVLANRTTDPVVRGKALTILIRLGDFSRLADAVAFLSSESDTNQAIVIVKSALSYQMAKFNDAALIEKYYMPLFQNHNDFVRKNAAYAVRMAQVRSAAPLLIEGLQDSNEDVKYQCLMGLARVLHRSGDWAPSRELFNKNESDYIGRWQTWWKAYGQSSFTNSLKASSAE